MISKSIKNYPTTASFSATPILYTSAELGTNQTIDTTTPGGFNFVYGDKRDYTKSSGTTSDIERLYFNGFSQNLSWADSNTCKQYVGIDDYNGKDANSRTSSSFTANSILLNCPSSSTQTISNIRANDALTIRASNSNSNYSITNSSSRNLGFSGSGTNVIANITNHSFLENNIFWNCNLTGAGSSATITNLYGLRLYPPTSTTGLTVTNNWGVYSGWSSAKNYFAGGVGIGTTSFSNALTVAGDASISGALSKGSGSFKIDHPLPEKSETHHLVHSFIEGPRADLIYRGRVELVNGEAYVNIDDSAGMTEGTFVALCRDIQCFTSNDTNWDQVKGKVTGNQLHITCQNPQSIATVSWIVIGERQDKHMYDTEWTDSNGRVIVEPLKR